MAGVDNEKDTKTKIEKAVSQLKCVADIVDCSWETCKECSFDDAIYAKNAVIDAIKVLRTLTTGREGKKGEKSETARDTARYAPTFACGRCGEKLQRDFGFCPYCGCEIEWGIWGLGCDE